MDIEQMLEGGVHRMSHVYRYSSVPVVRKENVAEHSWYVAFYAMLIGQALARDGHEVDFGLLLSRALVHDVDESHTGDFLTYIKYGHPGLKRALDETSAKMIRKIEEDLNLRDSLMDFWTLAKADDIEGHIIRVVDLARVASYVWEEIRMGNKHIAHILPDCKSHVETFIRQYHDSPVTPYAHKVVVWIDSVFTQFKMDNLYVR
ncbi:MAG: HD domain-containing protein [Gammaproteobacteria bacterium]|nr:HD domain-containing protein [Gammaproteobacteria bacterium]